MGSAQLSKDDFIDIGQFICPTIEQELWVTWSGTEDALALGMRAHEPSDVVLNGHHFIAKQGAYLQIRTAVAEELATGRFNLAEKILRLAEFLCGECEAMANTVPADAGLEEVIRMFELMRRLRFPWMACMPIGDAGEDWMRSYATERGIGAIAVAEMVPDLPNSATADARRLYAFKRKIETRELPFEIGAIHSHAPELAAELETYSKQTEHIGTHHFWGNERTIESFMSAVHDALPSVSRPPVPTNASVLIIAQATKWRLECAEVSSRLGYAYRPHLARMAERCGMRYEDFIFLTTAEIKEATERGADFSDRVRERQKSFGMYSMDGTLRVFVEPELTDWMQRFGLLDSYEGVDSLTGAIGNKGRATGRVVVVREPKDIAKVERGMILVANATTPDFVPAMSKCIAFVTDQGGITSHAAIIAREMGKPCVIGAKIATQVFKDGDMVEVDANKGVVRILTEPVH